MTEPRSAELVRVARTTMPHRGLQSDAFKVPEGWRIVSVDWHRETVDVTWLVPIREDRTDG